MQKLKQEKEYGIGGNLRTLRTKKGYTQVEVVAKLELLGLNVSRVTSNKTHRYWYICNE